MVLNPVEVGVLQQLLMRIYLLNFGASMVIGRLIKIKKRYMKKDIKGILSVSMAAMEVPSSAIIDTPIDISFDVRDDPGDSDTTNFDDSIPSMDGIPSNAFSWHGDTS
jgi:hypothetical protein